MIDSLYEQLITLCEVRGELDPESNEAIETKIAVLQRQILELEEALS
jgi:hypothetical protein